MKMLEKNQEKEIMLIQVYDLIKLKNRCLSLPYSKEAQKILNNLSAYDLKDFVVIDDPREVRLLKVYDFIYYFSDIEKYDEKDLEKRITRLKNSIREINKRLENEEEYKKAKKNLFFVLKYEELFTKLRKYEGILNEIRLYDNLYTNNTKPKKR